MDDNTIPIISSIIVAAIVGAVIWAFFKYTKLFLLILLLLFLLCAGIGIFILVYDKYGPGFKTVGEQNMQRRAEALIVRIRRCRRFSNSARDTLSNRCAEQLLQIANDLLNVINKTPDSAGKAARVKQRTDELERAVEKLEELNLTTAMTDAGQLRDLEDEFRIMIESMQHAQRSVRDRTVQMPYRAEEQSDDEDDQNNQQTYIPLH